MSSTDDVLKKATTETGEQKVTRRRNKNAADGDDVDKPSATKRGRRAERAGNEDSPRRRKGKQLKERVVQEDPDRSPKRGRRRDKKDDDMLESWAEEELEIIVPDEETEIDVSDEEDEEPQYDNSDGIDHFQFLPDECVLNLYAYLTEPQIGQISSVCQRLNKLTFDESVWQAKSKRWFYIPANQLTPGKTKDYYITKYNIQKQQEENQRNVAIRQEFMARKYNAAQRCKSCLTFAFFNRVADYVSVLCLILTTIFATIKLEGTVDWTWRTVLIPLYFPIFQMALSIPAFDLARRTFDRASIPDRVGKHPHIVWQFLFVERRPYRGMIYSTIVCLLAFFILLLIKLNGAPNGETGIPSGVVMIPLMILCCIAFQAPFTGCCSHDTISQSYYQCDRLLFAMAPLGPLFVMLFLALKLDGAVAWDWYIVLVPFWVMMCMIVCTTFVMVCSCCSFCSDNSNLMSDRWFYFWMCVACWAFLLVPFLVWVTLIAQNLEGDAPERSWREIFVPIYIVEALLLGGCIFGDVIVFGCN